MNRQEILEKNRVLQKAQTEYETAIKKLQALKIKIIQKLEAEELNSLSDETKYILAEQAKELRNH